MNQATLEFPKRVPPPLARSTDPKSSFDAAERAREFIGTHEQRILAVLRATGKPMTAHEIGAMCGLNNVQVTRRAKAIANVDKNHVTQDEHGHVCSMTGRRLETFQATGRPAHRIDLAEAT